MFHASQLEIYYLFGLILPGPCIHVMVSCVCFMFLMGHVVE